MRTKLEEASLLGEALHIEDGLLDLLAYIIIVTGGSIQPITFIYGGILQEVIVLDHGLFLAH